MILHLTHSNIGVERGEGALSSQANLALVRARFSSVGLRDDTELTNIQGKTIFLFYVLLRRLSAGLPTAFHVFSDKFFLFTESGASRHDVVDESGLELPPGTWALTNSGEVIERPCPAFLCAPQRRVWIIQATSPKRSRWHEWCKQLKARFYVMDYFPADELEVLG